MSKVYKSQKCTICKKKIQTVEYYKNYQFINDSGMVLPYEGHFKTTTENGMFITYSRALPSLSSVGPNGQCIDRTFLICNDCKKTNYDEKLRSILLRCMEKRFANLIEKQRECIEDWKRAIAKDQHEIELLRKIDLKAEIKNAHWSSNSMCKGWRY